MLEELSCRYVAILHNLVSLYKYIHMIFFRDKVRHDILKGGEAIYRPMGNGALMTVKPLMQAGW